MDIRKLTYFVEVVNEKSFSRAAQKLYVSQPMLSKTVRELEEEFQARLIERNNKKFQLTDIGRIVYQQSLKVLKEYQELEHLLESADKRLTGSVSLSIPPIIMKIFFEDLISRIQKKYPDLHMDLFEHGSYKVLEYVLSESADIGAVMLPVPTEGIEIHPIVYSKCVLLVSRDHPLAGAKCVDMLALRNEKFVMFNRYFTVYEMAVQACLSRGFTPDVTFQSSRSSFIFDRVSRNQGISVIPEPIFPQDDDTLCKVDITPEIPWTLALVVKKNKYMSPAAMFVLNTFLSYFRDGEEI